MRNLLIIGCGHWGRNYVRVFVGQLGAGRITVVDPRQKALDAMRAAHPGLGAAASLEEALRAGGSSAAVVSTPAATHFDVVCRCLEAGLDVLAEKPLALTVAHAERMAALARERRRILMVGHTFLYHPAVRRVRDLIRKGVCGDIYYMKSTRTHLGLVRPDVNAVWDLAPHDAAIFQYFTGHEPLAASALGACFLHKGKEDVAFINLQYPGNVLANIHVSWADSNKERTVEVVGSRARIVFDDLNALERVKIYEKGISSNVAGGDTYGEFLYALRDGDIYSPKIEPAEPLQEVCREFLRCVRSRRPPLTGAENGVAVVRTMCAIERSLAEGGRRIVVSAGKGEP